MVCFPKEVFSHVLSFLVLKEPSASNCLDTLPVLRKILRDNGLKVGGCKLALINRLLAHGFWARRPYWDTNKTTRVMNLPQPCWPAKLTFRQYLHSKEDWDRHNSTMRSNLEALVVSAITRPDKLTIKHRNYENILVFNKDCIDPEFLEKFEHYHSTYLDVQRMYQGFVNAAWKSIALHQLLTRQHWNHIFSTHSPLSTTAVTINAPPPVHVNSYHSARTLFICLYDFGKWYASPLNNITTPRGSQGLLDGPITLKLSRFLEVRLCQRTNPTRFSVPELKAPLDIY